MKKLGMIVIALLIGASAWAYESAQIKNSTGGVVHVISYTDGVCTQRIAGDVSVDGTVTATGAINAVPTGAGTASVSTVTASESGLGSAHTTVLTFNNVVFTVDPEGSGANTNAWGSVKVYDFPEGRILIEGVTVSNLFIVPQTNVIPLAAGGDYAFGTAAATTNALSGTMVDLCASVSVDPITNKASGALAASAQFDGTSTAKDMYFNLAVDQDDTILVTAGTNTMSGVATVNWKWLGDY